jgi:crotonobetainyl-CoA:carnitine CoA-transferase CaiB-like acyl-CoA transferase
MLIDSGPLANLVVVDFTRAVAGPFATQLLADRGARVIKIEDPGTGDECRYWGPVFKAGESAYQMALNRNKESVALDLKSDLGREAVAKLIVKADVLIENFRVGIAERLGFGWEQASALNPRLVYASISGFRRDSEESGRAGYDLIAQAMSGLMWANRMPNGDPFRVVYPLTDITTGMYASHAILTALYEREHTGKGRRVWVSLVESLMSTLCSVTPMQLISGEEPKMGAAIVPYQMFRASDGPLVAGTPNERIWVRFAEALDRKDWLDDPRFANNKARCENREHVLGEIQGTIAKMTRAECLERLARFDVPSGPILTVTEANESGRMKTVDIDHPTAGPIRVPGNPIEGLGQACNKPSPLLGEHTAKVLAELGLA